MILRAVLITMLVSHASSDRVEVRYDNDQIGHAFKEGSLFNFLYDTSGIYLPIEGASQIELGPAALQYGASIHLSSHIANYSVRPPEDYQAYIAVELLWCADGVEFNVSRSRPIQVEISLQGVLLQSLHGDAFSAESFKMNHAIDGSLAHADGTCVFVNITTRPFLNGSAISHISFSSLEITIPPLFSFMSQPSPTLYPSISSFIAFAFEPLTNGSAIASDPGPILVFIDTIPPYFENCPTQAIYSFAEAGHISTNVSFQIPIPRDNVAVASWSTNAPDDFEFTIRGSPHAIEYRAIDEAGNVGICKFSVVVYFDPVYSGTSSYFIQSRPFDIVHRRASFQTIGISNDWINSEIVGPWLDFNFTNQFTSQFGFLVLGSNDRYYISITEGLSVHMEIDLLWKTHDANTSPRNLSNAFVVVQPYLPSSTSNFDPVPNFNPVSDNWFQTDPATAVTETYLRIKGRAVVPSSFSVNGFNIQLEVPQGVTLNGEFFLQPNSYVRFTGYTTSELVASTYDGPLTIVDMEAPDVVYCPDVQTVYSSAETQINNTVLVNYTEPLYHDNLHVNLIMSNAPRDKRFLVPSTTLIQYYATDDWSNSDGSCSFNVIVIDDTPPFIVCAPDQEYNLTFNSSTVSIPPSALEPNATTFNDNSGQKTFTSINTVSTEIPYGIHSISRDITDSSGNIFSLPTGLFLKLGVVTLVSPKDYTPRVSMFSLGDTNLTYVAIDRAGNTATCVLHIRAVTPTAASQSSGLSTSASVAIGVSIGGAFLLVLILLLVLSRRLRRQRAKAHDFTRAMQSLSDIAIDGGPRAPREINRSHIKVLEVLGKGNFGEVTKGLLSEVPGTPGYLVAVKSSTLSQDSGRASILQEAVLMAQFDHPNVCGLLGVVTIGEPLLVVIEYCEHGALNKFLEKNDLPVLQKYQLAGDCAEGLAYLSSHNFVHRDVAARNVLLSSEKRAKIADFGMSRKTIDSDYYRSAGGQLPIRWTAPEALEEHKFSQQSDCWSFGILMYEIWTKGEAPYKGMNNQKVWTSVSAGYRLPCPPGCSADAFFVMSSCWKEVGERPTFELLVDHLRGHEAVLKKTIKLASLDSLNADRRGTYPEFIKGESTPSPQPSPSQDHKLLGGSELTSLTYLDGTAPGFVYVEPSQATSAAYSTGSDYLEPITHKPGPKLSAPRGESWV